MIRGRAAVLTVSQLNRFVRSTLEENPRLREVYVQGELSNVVRHYSSGHIYFALKDDAAAVRGVMFRSNAMRLQFELENGMMVLVRGFVTLYERDGTYQINATDIQPSGIGALQVAYEQLKRRLEAEGLFDSQYKQLIPSNPERIAVITSPTAAGYEDFLNQLANNKAGYPFYPKLFPALMQGERTEESVIAALDRVYRHADCFDVVVIIRGGGATSDLNSFDSYLLAANCAQFPLPIITGIGHERDDTVLDSVAHTRVKTPTAAAELLIHQVAEVAEHLEELSMRIQQGAYMLLDLERRRLETLQTRIPNLVHRKLADARFSLLAAKKDLSQVTKALVARQSHRLELLQQRIADASPDKLLSRGYSITIKDGKAVTDASLLKPGEHLITRLSKGEVRSVVEK